MRFEPFGREGVRGFSMSDLTPKSAWRFVTRSGLGWILIVFGLIVGIGAGGGAGSAENGSIAQASGEVRLGNHRAHVLGH